MKGTVGFVDGQLSMLPNDQMMDDIVDTADTDSVSTLCDDKEPELKGRYYEFGAFSSNFGKRPLAKIGKK